VHDCVEVSGSRTWGSRLVYGKSVAQAAMEDVGILKFFTPVPWTRSWGVIDRSGKRPTGASGQDYVRLAREGATGGLEGVIVVRAQDFHRLVSVKRLQCHWTRTLDPYMGISPRLGYYDTECNKRKEYHPDAPLPEECDCGRFPKLFAPEEGEEVCQPKT